MPSQKQSFNVIFITTKEILNLYQTVLIDIAAPLQMNPQFVDYKLSSAEALINHTFQAVDEAHVMVLILGGGEDEIPQDDNLNPQQHSLLELAYRRMVQLQKPIYAFRPRMADFQPETSVQKLYQHLIEAKHQIISVKTVSELETEIAQQLATFRDKQTPSPLPRPPQIYSHPPYALTKDFIGREAELQLLDQWAESNDQFFVLEALGGQGKSALAWEWVTHRRQQDFDGIVWWSFYERGATVDTLIIHTLAYLTGQHPNVVKRLDLKTRTETLLEELRQKKVLLVLDGFERALIAYAGLGSAYLRDDNISETQDDRACINPRDEQFLDDLLESTSTKVIITTRLMPSALQFFTFLKSSVRHHKLAGLELSDARDMLSSYNIFYDDEDQLNQFLESVGRHCLVIKIVAGTVAEFKVAEGDFDRWYELRGKNLNLSKLAITEERQTHILSDAFQGLSPFEQKVLAQIAMLGRPTSYAEINKMFNPYLPPQPPLPPLPPLPQTRRMPFGTLKLGQLMAERSRTSDTNLIRRLDSEIILERLISEKINRDIEGSQEQLKLDEIAIKQKRRELIQQHQHEYESSAAYLHAVEQFEAVLGTLENRGLLDWDKNANIYDLHPLIRGYISERIDPEQKAESQERIIEYHASQPLKAAQLLSTDDIYHDVEIYRGYYNMEQYKQAVQHFSTRLSHPLHRLGENRLIIQLLSPFFETDTEVRRDIDLPNISVDLALAYTRVGELEKANYLLMMALDPTHATNDSQLSIATALTNYGYNLTRMNQLAKANYVYSLAAEISATDTNPDVNMWSALEQLEFALMLGDWESVAIWVDIIQHQEAPSISAEFWRIRYDIASAEYAMVKNPNQARALLTKAYENIQLYRNRRRLENLEGLWAEYEYSQGHYDAAMEHALEAMSLANAMGHSTARYRIIAGLIDAQLGNQDDAFQAVAEAIGDTRMPIGDHAFVYAGAAEISLRFDNLRRAQKLALDAYTDAWADGPPYARGKELERIRKLFEQLELPLPNLPINHPEHFDLRFNEAIREKFLNPDKPFKGNTAKPQQRIEVQGNTWLQIGTIAFFGVGDETGENPDMELIRRISTKLSSLNDMPMPIIESKMGHPIRYPTAKDFEVKIERIEWENLAWNSHERLALDKTFVIVFVRTHNNTGETAYAYVNVRGDRLEALLNKLASGDLFRLDDYATLVSVGLDMPDLSVRQKMSVDFLFGEYYINARLFPTLERVNTPTADDMSKWKTPFMGREAFQIGTVSTFGLEQDKDLDITRQLVTKLSLLNSFSFPISYSSMGDEVSIAFGEKKPQEPKLFSEIEWELAENQLFTRIFLIIYLSGRDSTNLPVYAYINIRLDRLEHLLNKLESGQLFDLDTTATVILSGHGDPDENTRKKLLKDYLFSDRQLNVRRFPPLEHVKGGPEPKPSTSLIQIKGSASIHIGTIAMFDFMEPHTHPLVEDLAEKIAHLNAVELPICISKMGEEVPLLDGPIIESSPMRYADIVWTDEELDQTQSVFVIIRIITENAEGAQFFAYVNVRMDRLGTLLNEIEKDTLFELSQFATIVQSGLGVPDDETHEKLANNYLFYSGQLNVRLFPPLSDLSPSDD